MPDFKKMKPKAAGGKAGTKARGAGTKAKAAAPARKPARAAKAAPARKPARAAKAAPARKPARPGKATKPSTASARPPPELTPDPEGFFVARVRGEEAVREAPHAMGEGGTAAGAAARAMAEAGPGAGAGGPLDEGFGDLPPSYEEDALVALARDPRTVFLYWEHTAATRKDAFTGLESPRAQLRLFARAGDGWEPVRTVDFALEARGYYLHDLEPGRTYRAEIHLVDRTGRERRLGGDSNEVDLPPEGPSAVVDDRFARIPWDLPLAQGPGPGRPGGPFPEEARARLASLSDWSRFRSQPGGAGEDAERPSSPSSPRGPFGGRDR